MVSQLQWTTRYSGGEMPVETGGQAEFAAAYGTDAGFADVFQVNPVAGRLIASDEFRTKATVAVVGEGFAVRHFGEANRAVGQVLHWEGKALTDRGRAARTIPFPSKGRIMVPVALDDTTRTGVTYRAVALLKPGVTVEAARAFLSAVGARLQTAFPRLTRPSHLRPHHSKTSSSSAAA